MMALVVFAALPLAAFVSLAALPAGRPAFVGLAVAAGALGLGMAVGRDSAEGMGLLVWQVWWGAVALAGLAQGLRWLAARLGLRVPYAAIAGLCLAGVALPAWYLAGGGF